jgi:hypothetical protein
MRSEYFPSETFCMVCGFAIRERQIAGNIEGIIAYRKPGQLNVDPFDAYLCDECLSKIQGNIEGGIERARRRSNDSGGTTLGEQNTPRDKKDEH